MLRGVAAVVLSLAPLLAAQPVFKSGVELVRIPVSVSQGNKPLEPVDDTGGVVYRLRIREDAAAMARAFVEDLRFQYTLGYSSVKAMDGKYRRVRVESRRRGYAVRHRGGYLALPSKEGK